MCFPTHIKLIKRVWFWWAAYELKYPSQCPAQIQTIWPSQSCKVEQHHRENCLSDLDVEQRGYRIPVQVYNHNSKD
jgi:hypothetical protein